MKKLLMILSIFIICTSQHQLAMGANPIVEAGIFNDWPVVKKLIRDHGYTPNSPESPLPIISFIYHRNAHAIIELVTKYGANIDLSDPQFGTPMTYALMRGYFDIFELLYKLGAQLDVADCFGVTPQYLCKMNKKSDDLNNRLAHGETVALSKLNLPQLPTIQNHKRIQRSKTASVLLPTQFPELDEHKATVEYENQEEFHPVAKTTKSKSCPQLQAHANYLTHKLQQIQLNQDGTAHLGETRFKQLQTL